MLTHTNGISHINERLIPLRSRTNVLMLETITRLRLGAPDRTAMRTFTQRAGKWVAVFVPVRSAAIVCRTPAILRAEIRRILYLVYGSLVSSLNSRYVTMSSSPRKPTTKVQILDLFCNPSKLWMCVCAIYNANEMDFSSFHSRPVHMTT